MKQHRNLPFFVPHAGCPNCCVFCSQVKITGESAEKDLNSELNELKTMLDSVGDGFRESQIAFFGGSFTAIERHRMESLLSLANEYIDLGAADSIRISTRPDCIDESILDTLKKYRVTHIELGVQSTCDSVLSACARGHNASDSFRAAKLIKDYGMEFVGQMMIGLPESTADTEVQTAKDIVSMGASEARIYPTVVFEGTRLYDMTVSGEYTPLTLESAVDRTAKCCRIFHSADVNMLRVGLHSSENLKNAPFGANHPSIGELVKSRVYTDIIAEKAGDCGGKTLCVAIKHSDISMICGHNGVAINRLKAQTGAAAIEISGADLPRFCPTVETRSV